MLSPKSCRFNNQHSVRFTLDSFVLPVTSNTRKHRIYTNYITGLRGTKRKLLPAAAPVEKYGYDYVTRWNNLIFTADRNGLYCADQYLLRFTAVDETVNPQQICAVNDRLFLISMDRRRIIYSVDLTTNWTNSQLLLGAIHINDHYGQCLDIVFYRNQLLVICENGLLLIDRNLHLSHLSDDSELLKANLSGGALPIWESDWFSLHYATDTQNLREVFLKTDTALTLLVASNRTQRTIHITAGDGVQKIKTNLNGDQFKLTIIPSGNHFCITDLSAVVIYGKRGS